MNQIDDPTARLTPTTFLESMVRVGVLALMTVFCFKIAFPFITILVWALMLAIMLYPLHQKMARKLGGKQRLASVLMVLAVFLLIAPPVVFVAVSHVGEVGKFKDDFDTGDMAIPAPDPGVKEWPVIGGKLYPAWSEAASSLPNFLGDHASQVKSMIQKAFSMAGELIVTMGLFLGAFLIAGVMMALADPGTKAMTRIFSTLAGHERGPGFQDLVVGTVRSVATGVIGVAFIQALIFAVGLILAGVPAAGLLAGVVFFLAVIQIPLPLVGIPVIIWVWVGGDASVVANVIFTIIFLVASVADNFLKPIFLGRGVAAPMPVILIGALGGMMAMGMIGLFLGAVVLAVGYKIFMGWTDQAGLAMSETDNNEQKGVTR